MMTALEHLARDGYREAVLWTLTGYERGQRFYEAMGWKADRGERDGGRQIRVIDMTCTFTVMEHSRRNLHASIREKSQYSLSSLGELES